MTPAPHDGSFDADAQGRPRVPRFDSFGAGQVRRLGSMSKAKLRLSCGVLLLAPVLAIWAAPVFREALLNEQPVQWLRNAVLAHFGVGVFLVAAPFIVEFLTRQQRGQLKSMGVDIDLTLLLMGVGGASVVSWGAAILFGYGETTEYLLGSAVLSFVIGTFWAWRLRYVLR
jgi:hypothetical protein